MEMAIRDYLQSDKNIRAMVQTIARKVRVQHGLDIVRESDPRLWGHIRASLQQEFKKWVSLRGGMPPSNQPTTAAGFVRMFNVRVVAQTVPMVVNYHEDQLRLRRDQNRLPMPLAHATNVSIRGSDVEDMGRLLTR